MADNNKGDWQDIARFGGDLLKKGMSSGLDAIKEAKESLPGLPSKDTLQRLAKEVIPTLVSSFFEVARQHKLDVTIELKEKEPTPKERSTPKKG